MEPVHIVTDKENISELVLMPGDPLRAKYVADNFLEDAKLVNDVRNMLGFTGTYKGVKVTIMGSGMGIPSVGIYAYELAHFYGVKKIIRIGSAGALSDSVHVRDLVVSKEAMSVSSYAKAYNGDDSDVMYADNTLLDDIKASITSEMNVHFGRALTSDVFDVYSNSLELTYNMLGTKDFLASDMETFGLYFIGKITEIKTASILSITNSMFEPDKDMNAIERETSLNDMITLALDAVIR